MVRSNRLPAARRAGASTPPPRARPGGKEGSHEGAPTRCCRGTQAWALHFDLQALNPLALNPLALNLLALNLLTLNLLTWDLPAWDLARGGLHA